MHTESECRETNSGARVVDGTATSAPISMNMRTSGMRRILAWLIVMGDHTRACAAGGCQSRLLRSGVQLLIPRRQRSRPITRHAMCLLKKGDDLVRFFRRSAETAENRVPFPQGLACFGDDLVVIRRSSSLISLCDLVASAVVGDTREDSRQLPAEEFSRPSAAMHARKNESAEAGEPGVFQCERRRRARWF